MIPRQKVIIRQLQLITLLVVGVLGLMLIFNLAYLVDSHLRNTEAQLAQQRDHIFATLENAVMREKERDPAMVIANDSEVRNVLRIAVSKLPMIKYAAIVNEKGVPLAAVNLARDTDMAVGEQDMKALLDTNPVFQMGSLLWGRSVYHYSFLAPLSHRNEGKPFTVQIRFGLSAASVRGVLTDNIFINLLIVMIGLMLSIAVAFKSANLLLQPVELLAGQLEKLERGELHLQDEPNRNGLLDNGIVNKLQLLGKRLAGERTELEATRGRLTQIIGNIEERLLLLNRDRHVMLMSPKVDHLLGVPGIDLVGAKIDNMLGSNHPLVDLIYRAQQAHASVENVMMIDQHGQERARQILASVQFIEDKGEMVGMLISLRDFDSFRQFQSQLDYSDKLAALGRITSGVAHEVKNPLNAMVIHLEILRAKLDQPGADITPQLDILSSEIKRLDRVVQTFLNFTRPVQINLVPLDLNDLVHQVTRLAAAEAATHNVELREELSPDFLRVNGDADLLKQTLLNIIINGCQAMPRGGPLEIRTKRASSYALITIADRGVGIPSDMRDKIFKLYYTTKENGNGIGLAQAFRIVQLHNGRIEFDSIADVGTTFKISLPEV